MKLTQIRNATIIISYKNNNIIVDPMLAAKGKLPRLRYIGSKKKNPTVELPKNFGSMSQSITHALITHCQKGHFDHLDGTGRKFLRQKRVPTFSTRRDSEYLANKNIETIALNKADSFFDGKILQIPAVHTKGFLYPFLEHGVGYFISFPNEPTLYLMGDTILTDTIRDFIKENQPDYIVAPTGVAKFDFGYPLLLPEKDIDELFSISKGTLIANHMDALDHCRMSRKELTHFIKNKAYANRIVIPQDGETINLSLKA